VATGDNNRDHWHAQMETYVDAVCAEILATPVRASATTFTSQIRPRSHPDHGRFRLNGKNCVEALTGRRARYTTCVQTAAGTAPLSSVFFGGGTPSLVPPPLVGRILDALRTRFALSATAEVSMEMDPVRVLNQRPVAEEAEEAAPSAAYT
jgi:hypothetical protein